MRPYGAKHLRDFPIDCTDRRNSGILKLSSRCVCGCRKLNPHRRPKKLKSLKACERRYNKVF